MLWEDSLGVTIPDEAAESIQTPAAATTWFATKLGASDLPNSPCLTLRAFLRVRRALVDGAGLARRQIRPQARLRDLLPWQGRRAAWSRITASADLPAFPSLGWGILISTPTIGDLARWVVAYSAHALKHPGEPWTRSEIRTVVRAAITDICGLSNFSDDAEWVKDLNLD